MLSKIYYVALGGFLGGIARYGVSLGVTSMMPTEEYPYETFIVNILGCFLMGLFFYPSWKYIKRGNFLKTASGQALICTGFLGAFTTYTSFGLEIFQNLVERNPHILVIDLFVEIALGLLFVNLGGLIKKRFTS